MICWQSDNTFPRTAHILGVAPSGSGGVANRPGTAAFGDTRAIESTTFPATDPEYYGAIWAQEIGHNFGRMHVSTSHKKSRRATRTFPIPMAASASRALAIGTEGWNGTPFVMLPGIPADGSKHAHDFMSYGQSNDAADHTHSWVSPFTYQGLMSSFPAQALASAAPQPAVDKLVINGSVSQAGVATLRPFYITKTGYAKGAGTTGAFSVTLLDADGKTLLVYHFDALTVENSPTLMFSEFVPWKTATKLIVLKHNQTVLAKRKVTPHNPTVEVLRPKSGETWGAKATVTWRAADFDKDALTYTVLYNTGVDKPWVPIATDVTGLSASTDTALLVGSKKARVRVRATDGVNTTEADSGTFTVPEHPPLVTILRPANGNVLRREGAEFSGAAYDPRERMLPAARLKWTSNRDGELGSGPHITMTKPLSSGTHVITLTATNSQGRIASKQVKVVAK